MRSTDPIKKPKLHSQEKCRPFLVAQFLGCSHIYAVYQWISHSEIHVVFTFSVFCWSSDSSCLTKRPAGCCPIQRFVAWIWEMKKMPGSWIHGRLLGKFFIFSPNLCHFYHLSIWYIFFIDIMWPISTLSILFVCFCAILFQSRLWMICSVRRWQVTRHRQFSLFSWTTRNISGAKLPRLAWILSKNSSIWGWVKPWATEATITDALLTTVLNGAAAFGNHIPF